jgi:transposase-like protein
MARRAHTPEFKIQAVRMMTGGVLLVAEVSRWLGVGQGCPRLWREAAAKQGESAFPGPGNHSAERRNRGGSAPRSPASGPRGTS